MQMCASISVRTGAAVLKADLLYTRQTFGDYYQITRRHFLLQLVSWRSVALGSILTLCEAVEMKCAATRGSVLTGWGYSRGTCWCTSKGTAAHPRKYGYLRGLFWMRLTKINTGTHTPIWESWQHCQGTSMNRGHEHGVHSSGRSSVVCFSHSR